MPEQQQRKTEFSFQGYSPIKNVISLVHAHSCVGKSSKGQEGSPFEIEKMELFEFFAGFFSANYPFKPIFIICSTPLTRCLLRQGKALKVQPHYTWVTPRGLQRGNDIESHCLSGITWFDSYSYFNRELKNCRLFSLLAQPEQISN